MGASAIRLVIAEVAADCSARIVDEASRAVLLGRDTFASGTIKSRTADAALAARRRPPAGATAVGADEPRRS